MMENSVDIREQMDRFYSGEGRKFSPITTLPDDSGHILDPRFRRLAYRYYKCQFEVHPSKQVTDNKQN